MPIIVSATGGAGLPASQEAAASAFKSELVLQAVDVEDYFKACLHEWLEWVREGRPDHVQWCERRQCLYFDVSCPFGGTGGDGATYWGEHPWSPRPSGFNWAVLRRLFRLRQICLYWLEMATRHHSAPIAPAAPPHAVEALVNDGFAFVG